MSFILSGGCAGFSRSEEGYQSRHQIEGPRLRPAGGSCGQPRCPTAHAQSPLSFHLSHFRYPRPLPARIRSQAGPLMASLALSPGPFFHEPKALHSLKKEAGLNLPMLKGGEGVAIGRPSHQGDGLNASTPFPWGGGHGHLWPWKWGSLGP